MEPVRTHRSRLVVEAARLHRARVRRRLGQTLIEGPHLLEEAVNAGVVIHRLFALPGDEVARVLAGEAGLDLLWVDETAMGRLAGTETPRGPVAVVEILDERIDQHRDLLVSWEVSDPGNVGSLVRIAWGFDWGYAYTESSADPWSPKALRSGAGGQFRVPVARIGGLEDLESWTIMATVVAGGDEPTRPPEGPVAVLVGEESAGLPEGVAADADLRVTIPLPGLAESLNAAVAAGIVVHQLTKPGEVGEGGV
jgi:TrmH family RNA methyltransferase